MPSPVLAAVVLVASFAPSAFMVWRGRSLRRLTADPLFAERMWALRRHSAAVTACSCAAIGFVAVPHSVPFAVAGWSALIAALTVSTHGFRRAVLGETWTVWAFAAFRARLWLAFGGFWLALLCAPAVVLAAGGAGWLVAVLLLAGLVLAHRRFPAVFCAVVGATPLDDPGLAAALDAMMAKTSIARPRLYRAGRPGGVIANAIALPSMSGGRVVFFSTLLERLTPCEAAAILAHELAHLEQFNAPVLARHGRVLVPLTVAGTVGVQALSLLWPPNVAALALVWSAAVLGSILYLAKGTKARETDGDARAAELVGGPAPVIAALVALHRIAHVPRRWDAATEDRSSHPALAKRIAALRSVQESVAAPVDWPVVVAAGESGGFVLFESDRLRHVTGVPVGAGRAAVDVLQHATNLVTFPYAALASVHLEPVAAGGVLVLIDKADTAKRISIAAASIPVLLAVLDRVDAHITPASSGIGNARMIRLVAILAGLWTVLLGQWPLVLPQVVIAAIRPSLPSAAAFAAAMGALTLLSASSPQRIDGSLTPTLLAAVCAAALVWQRSRLDVRERARLGLAAIVLWSAGAIGLVAIAGTEPVRLAVAAAGMPAGVVGPVSAAAWLSVQSRSAWSRAGVLASLAAAIAMSLAGTTWFADRFSHDPLLSTRPDVGAHRLAPLELPLLPAGAVRSDEEAWQLRVSPTGVAVAWFGSCEEEDEYDCDTRPLAIVPIEGQARSLAAADAQFAADETMVVLERAGSELVVRAEGLRGTRPEWAVSLAPLHRPSLRVNDRGEWVVTGTDGNRYVRLEGRLEASAVTRREWPIPYDDGDWAEWASDTGSVLGTRPVYDDGYALAGVPWLPAIWMGLTGTDWRTHLVDPGGNVLAASSLTVECDSSGPGERGIVCFATDTRRTHVWIVDPTGELRSGGWFTGDHTAQSAGAGSRWVTTSGTRCGWSIVDVAAGTRSLLRLPSGRCPYAAALSSSALAVATYAEGTTAVEVFQLPATR